MSDSGGLLSGGLLSVGACMDICTIAIVHVCTIAIVHLCYSLMFYGQQNMFYWIACECSKPPPLRRGSKAQATDFGFVFVIIWMEL